MELSEKIKRLRIQNNYKQEELADVCNVTRSAVSNWETGRRIPDWDNIVTIAKLFNVTVEDLASSKKISKSPVTFLKVIPEAKLKSNELPIFFTALFFMAFVIMLVNYMPRSDRLYYNNTHKYDDYFNNITELNVSFVSDSKSIHMPIKECEDIHSTTKTNIDCYKVFQGTLDLSAGNYTISFACASNNGDERICCSKEMIKINYNPDNLLEYDIFSQRFSLNKSNTINSKVKIVVEIIESCIYVSAFLV